MSGEKTLCCSLLCSSRSSALTVASSDGEVEEQARARSLHVSELTDGGVCRLKGRGVGRLRGR